MGKRECGKDTIAFFRRDDRCVGREKNCAVLLHRTEPGPMGFTEAGFGSM